MTKPNYKKWLFIVFLLLLIASAFPAAVIFLKPENCIVRSWVINFRQVMALLWGLYLFIVLIFISFSSLYIIFKILLWLVSLYIFWLLLLFFFLGMPSNVEIRSYHETVLVRQSVWLDKDRYYFYQEEGPFYLRFLCDADFPYTTFPSETPSNPAAEDESPAPADSPASEDTHYLNELQLIADGEMAIYHTLPEQYKIPANTDTVYPIETFTAKGDPELIVSENDTGITYIRYDHVSDNQNCLLYVLYYSEKAPDGSYSLSTAEILDMYAYVIADGRVVPSGRTSWSDAGSQEYQDITQTTS